MAGSLKIGGDARVSVQSMTKVASSDYPVIKRACARLASAGAELIRTSILSRNDISPAIRAIHASGLPGCADIHYDWRLGVLAVQAGFDKIRVNPGNMKRSNLIKVLQKAKEEKIPVRLGFNSGSLPRKSSHLVRDMLSFAKDSIRFCEDQDCFDLVISMKTPSVDDTVAVYRALAPQCEYPFHIGITEAGAGYAGVTKSVLGLGILLSEGIGDTVRISLTESPEEEVRWTRATLQSLGLRRFEPELISCPTCGRCRVNLMKVRKGVEKRLQKEARIFPKINTLKIAVMGCSVNGPGEAKEADVGIAGGVGEWLLFCKGRVKGSYSEDLIEEALFSLIRELSNGTDRYC